MPAIRTEGLRKTYGPVRALDGLDLTVEPGTVFGFLGPNGAGKTTTIRILTGLARPSSGKAWVTGIEVAHRRELAHHIGYLPEEPAFYPWMTPAEFLDHVGRAFGLTAAERAARTEELLELVGLAGVRQRRIRGFSRGMRQRLGLAQALVNRPELLLLDEPVSALDPGGRKEVLELIERLRGTCTVFMSTHILADVERVCDAVGILAAGKLIVAARREELIARYAVPMFEIECENGHAVALQAWAETLRGEPWVSGISVNGPCVRVMVTDVEVARRELLTAIASAIASAVATAAATAGLPLTRYEMVKPTLEDIFLRLVGKEGR